MYEEFYHLDARPFSATPDPRFLVMSRAHGGASTMLRNAIASRAPIITLTGEPGVGKTTLARQLIHEQLGEALVGVVSSYRDDGHNDLLDWTLSAFEQPLEEAPRAQRFKQLHDFLEAASMAGRRCLLMIDEAHGLSPASLEDVRLLTNMNVDHRDVLQVLLIGLPGLVETLSRPELEHLRQRIAFHIQLGPLAEDEAEDYIAGRVLAAGAEHPLFSPESCASIYRAASGSPRLMNIICDMCLVMAFADGRETVDEALVGEFLENASENGIHAPFA